MEQEQKTKPSFQYDEEDLGEEVPLTGEIQAVDTYFTIENELVQPDYKLGQQNSETMDLDGGAPTPQRRIYEGAQEENPKGLYDLEDAYTEFGGELSPVPVLNHNMVTPVRETGINETTHYRRSAVEAPERQENMESAGVEKSRLPGWIAIVLAISSMFYLPAILGPAGAVAGVIAYLSGNRALGIWSVALGLISLFASLLLIPYAS